MTRRDFREFEETGIEASKMVEAMINSIDVEAWMARKLAESNFLTLVGRNVRDTLFEVYNLEVVWRCGYHVRLARNNEDEHPAESQIAKIWRRGIKVSELFEDEDELYSR